MLPQALPLARRPSSTNQQSTTKRRLARQFSDPPLLKLAWHNWNGGADFHIADRESFFESQSFDIIAVSEHRLKPTQVKKLVAKNYRWFGIANEDGNGGVGFLVALHLAPYITVLKPTHKDQLWIRLAASRSSDADIFLCSVYMPQEDSKVTYAQAAFDALSESIEIYSNKGECAVMGDVNAKLSAPQTQEEERLIGRYDMNPERTRNGSLLAEVITRHDLFVLNGHSTKNDGERWHTWSRFDSKAGVEKRSTLDLLLISHGLRLDCPGEFGVHEVCLESDHLLAWGKIRCPRMAPRKPNVKYRRFKLKLLVDKSVDDGQEALRHMAAYEGELVKAFESFSLPPTASVFAAATTTTTAITTTLPTASSIATSTAAVTTTTTTTTTTPTHYYKANGGRHKADRCIGS